ncbi:hypothetical protein MNBD_PLANCTO02-2804, partial [hydrothermal vent metagenome]
MRRFNSVMVFCSLFFAFMLMIFAGNLFGQDETNGNREKETTEVDFTPVPEQLIEQARNKGIDYLKSQQKEDGNWEFEGHNVGMTALCTLALLKNGVPETDPVVKKGIRYIHKNTKKLEKTYDIALTILLLTQIGNPSEKKLIRNLSARLVAGQCISGGWTYTCPTRVSLSVLTKSRVRLVNKSPGDNSCTQFAVLGLRAASSSAIGVKKALKNVELRFLKTQKEDGSWGYLVPKDLDIRTKRKGRKRRRGRKKPKEIRNTGGDNRPQRQTGTVSRNSMTFAALFCLTVSRAARIRKERKTKTGETKRRDVDTLIENPIFKKGLLKAGEYLQEKSDVGYFFWSSEQLGVLLGVEEFGGVNWFHRGANSLIKTQKEDGSWEDKRGSLHETSFALLFLRKANVGSDISWLLKGKPEKKFQIVTQEESPRYSSLQLAIEASEENDIIRIDGNGPFKSPHLIINHHLNIQAGFGYEPVLNFESGYNKKGIRYSPGKDVDARNMMQVKKGTLTLEGLRMEMDPPNIVGGTNISWNAIRVNGGDLRLLNCRISEGNRKGMAAILFEKPGTILVKNSMLIGGRAAIEVEGNGKQEIQIENSLLFSNAGIRFVNKSGNDQSEITVTMKQVTL